MARPVRRGTSAVLAVVVGLLLAGCAGGEAEPESPFPPRPATVDVDRLDPCAVVTERQRADLALSAGRPATVPVGGVMSRACAWSNFDDGFNYTVQLVPLDAGEAVGAEGSELTQVGGFGAVRATGLGASTPICQLMIDAAEGATIRVQAQATLLGDDGRPLPFASVCPRASEFAGAVMATATET